MPTGTNFYSSCNPIIVTTPRCKIYTNTPLIPANYADPGYYSNGIFTYQVGTDGDVIAISDCGGSGCTNCCFIGNTLVTLKDGSQIPIKDIKVLDEVISFNEKENKQEVNKVVNLINKEVTSLIRYTISGGKIIESTDDHPYYVNGLTIASYNPVETINNNKFTYVKEIEIGDVVNLNNGDIAVIENIEVVSSKETVYTFEVETNHNYYANNVLVHNKTPGCSCCFNPSTGQHQQVSYNTDTEWCGCKCLGPGWTDSPGGCVGC
jgi:intein/homing endonuclease